MVVACWNLLPLRGTCAGKQLTNSAAAASMVGMQQGYVLVSLSVVVMIDTDCQCSCEPGVQNSIYMQTYSG